MGGGSRVVLRGFLACAVLIGVGCAIDTFVGPIDERQDAGAADSSARDGGSVDAPVGRDRTVPDDGSIGRDANPPDASPVDAVSDVAADAAQPRFCDTIGESLLCLDFDDESDLDRITGGRGEASHETVMVVAGAGALRVLHRDRAVPVGLFVETPAEEVWIRASIWVSGPPSYGISLLALSKDGDVVSAGMNPRGHSGFSNVTEDPLYTRDDHDTGSQFRCIEIGLLRSPDSASLSLYIDGEDLGTDMSPNPALTEFEYLNLGINWVENNDQPDLDVVYDNVVVSAERLPCKPMP